MTAGPTRVTETGWGLVALGLTSWLVGDRYHWPELAAPRRGDRDRARARARRRARPAPGARRPPAPTGPGDGRRRRRSPQVDLRGGAVRLAAARRRGAARRGTRAAPVGPDAGAASTGAGPCGSRSRCPPPAAGSSRSGPATHVRTDPLGAVPAPPRGDPDPARCTCVRSSPACPRSPRASCTTSRGWPATSSPPATSPSTRCGSTSRATTRATSTGSRRRAPGRSWCASSSSPGAATPPCCSTRHRDATPARTSSSSRSRSPPRWPCVRCAGRLRGHLRRAATTSSPRASRRSCSTWPAACTGGAATLQDTGVRVAGEARWHQPGGRGQREPVRPRRPARRPRTSRRAPTRSGVRPTRAPSRAPCAARRHTSVVVGRASPAARALLVRAAS